MIKKKKKGIYSVDCSCFCGFSITRHLFDNHSALNIAQVLCVAPCVVTFPVFAAEEQDGDIDPCRGFRALPQDFYALVSVSNTAGQTVKTSVCISTDVLTQAEFFLKMKAPRQRASYFK